MKTSPTAVGRADSAGGDTGLIDTINQVFTLFRINYHNQYHAAFGDTATLNQAKRLWKESLGHFNSEQLLRAARKVIEQSDYLPTLNKMLTACEDDLADYGLPDARSAYLEAANKPSPKNAQSWSHPIVYHAGKILGWYAISHVPENVTYPAFVKVYRDLVRRLLAGEDFTVDAPLRLEQQSGKRPDVAAIEEELRTLRNLLGE